MYGVYEQLCTMKWYISTCRQSSTPNFPAVLSNAPKRTLPSSKFVPSWLQQPSASAVPIPRTTTGTTSSDSENEETPQFGPKQLPMSSLINGGSKPLTHKKTKSKKIRKLFHLHRSKNNSVHRNSLKYQRLIKGRRLLNTHLKEINRQDDYESSHTEFAIVTVKSMTPNSSALHDTRPCEYSDTTGDNNDALLEITHDTHESISIHTQGGLSPKIPEEQSKQATRETAERTPPSWVKTGVAVLPPVASLQKSSEHAVEPKLIHVDQQSSGSEGEVRKKAVTAAQLVSLSKLSTPITARDDSSPMEQKHPSTKEVDTSTTVSSNGITHLREISEVKPPLPLSALRKSSEPLIPTLSALTEHQEQRNRSCSVCMPATVASRGSMQPQPNHSSWSQFNLTTNRQGVNHALTKRDHVLSIADLIQPARCSIPEIRAQQSLAAPLHTPDDVLGVLKIRVTGVNMGISEEQQSNSMLSQLLLNPEKSVHMPQTITSPSEGLYCTLSINGGSTRLETSVRPIYPHRPVIWDHTEEFIFYAKTSQQIFVTCSKTGLEQDSKVPDNLSKMGPSSVASKIIREEVCIGAAALPISTVHISSATNDSSAELDICHPLSKLQFEPNSLPLQPTGSVLLQAVLYGETTNA